MAVEGTSCRNVVSQKEMNDGIVSTNQRSEVLTIYCLVLPFILCPLLCRHCAEVSDVVVCEGTGHCAVGSIVGMNNAKVAHLIGADMVLIANGGLVR